MSYSPLSKRAGDRGRNAVAKHAWIVWRDRIAILCVYGNHFNCCVPGAPTALEMHLTFNTIEFQRETIILFCLFIRIPCVFFFSLNARISR